MSLIEVLCRILMTLCDNLRSSNWKGFSREKSHLLNLFQLLAWANSSNLFESISASFMSSLGFWERFWFWFLPYFLMKKASISSISRSKLPSLSQVAEATVFGFVCNLKHLLAKYSYPPGQRPKNVVYSGLQKNWWFS